MRIDTPAVTQEQVLGPPYNALDNITDAVIAQIADRLLARYSHSGGALILLSAQELRIAVLLGQGVTMKDIGKQLSFRHSSDIANRVRTCCRKHGLTRHQLAVYGAFLNLRKENL